MECDGLIPVGRAFVDIDDCGLRVGQNLRQGKGPSAQGVERPVFRSLANPQTDGPQPGDIDVPRGRIDGNDARRLSGGCRAVWSRGIRLGLGAHCGGEGNGRNDGQAKERSFHGLLLIINSRTLN